MYRTDELLLLEHLTYMPDIPPIVSILKSGGMKVGEYLDLIDLDKLDKEKVYSTQMNGFDFKNVILAMKKNPAITEAKILEAHLDNAYGAGGGISIVVVNEYSEAEENGKHEAVVAFRGTADNEWTDDFEGAAQIDSLQQINALEWYKRAYENHDLDKYYVTVIGHSKGGNFAIFASAFACDAVKTQIQEVFTNDGPGFRKEITELKEYKDVLKKTKSFIPSYSIIGRLLSSGLNPKVVGSSAKGILQHNALTWQITDDHFQYTERAGDSIFVENVLDDWIKNVDDNARRLFVDQIFNILQAAGGDTMEEIKDSTLRDLGEAISMIRKIPKDQQKELSEVLEKLVRSGEKNIYELIGLQENLPEVIRKWAAKRESRIESDETDE